jgi:hypothetical protein
MKFDNAQLERISDPCLIFLSCQSPQIVESSINNGGSPIELVNYRGLSVATDRQQRRRPLLPILRTMDATVELTAEIPRILKILSRTR